MTTRRRLAESFGVRYEVNGTTIYSLDPQRLATVRPEQIRALQFTNSKAASIVAVAHAYKQSVTPADVPSIIEELRGRDDG